MTGERPHFIQSRHITGYEAAIRKVVPETFFKQAATIVQAHKPKDAALAGFEPELALKSSAHGDLNRPMSVYPGGREAKERRMTELRQMYANDPEALEQIDIYDHNSQYLVKIREYKDTFRSCDTKKREELEAWFKENYPHTTNRGE